jgi:hypothetical protein
MRAGKSAAEAKLARASDETVASSNCFIVWSPK